MSTIAEDEGERVASDRRKCIVSIYQSIMSKIEYSNMLASLLGSNGIVPPHFMGSQALKKGGDCKIKILNIGKRRCVEAELLIVFRHIINFSQICHRCEEAGVVPNFS